MSTSALSVTNVHIWAPVTPRSSSVLQRDKLGFRQNNNPPLEKYFLKWLIFSNESQSEMKPLLTSQPACDEAGQRGAGLWQRRCNTLTSQPACWATAGTLCRRWCNAARHTAWFVSSARPPAFAWRARTLWHLRAKAKRDVRGEAEMQPQALKEMMDSLLMEACGVLM